MMVLRSTAKLSDGPFRRCLGIACAVAVLCWGPQCSADTVPEGRVGQHVPDAAFATLESLADEIDASQIVVFAFLGAECPLAALYAPRLNDLAADFGDRNVQFIGIFSNAQDSDDDVAAYAKKFQLAFPVHKDRKNRLADLLGAQRTPEVFVIDPQRRVRFCGRIDDQYAIGFPRVRPDREFLRLAVEQLLAGENVAEPAVATVGCLIGREHFEPSTGRVTYANSIAAIMNEHCVRCHRPGEAAPFALTDFAEVRGWADMIVEVTSEGRMPPVPRIDDPHGNFVDVPTVSAAQIAAIERWISEGTPFGNPAEVPPPVEFTTGWHLSREPDLVVYASEEPFEVPAEGLIEYQYFTVDPGLTEDKWVTEVEISPGNPRVVHHAAVSLSLSDESPIKFRDPTDRIIAGYLPGMGFGDGGGPDLWKELKVARFIPAGSKFVFQLHYQAVGTAQPDRTKLGMLFCDPDEVEHVLVNRWILNDKFEIPPEAADYKVERISVPFPDGSRLVAVAPHMHLRGKSFKVESIFSDGTRELLLDVPKYDFNWQFLYSLRDPKLLPTGTRFHCTAVFDNSAANPANPDPSATVRWGDFTDDEMMVGAFAFMLTKDEYLDYSARPSEAQATPRNKPQPVSSPPVPDSNEVRSSTAMMLLAAALFIVAAIWGLRFVRRAG